ncbi:hypothetical protein CAC01_11275 [Streptomyces sp. CLI2509]|nr:hypothetical protein CAC01_11275 [Streptomyces sp. CLI2509]MYX22132.1 hypothetical protein [Streptomyces sp. SID8380]
MRGAVRRRPSLPRPVPSRRPPDRHQQRRLAVPQATSPARRRQGAREDGLLPGPPRGALP